MRKYSDVISWLAVLIGLGMLVSVLHGSYLAVSVLGLLVFTAGMYRLINNSKRKEMIGMFFRIEQLPEDERKRTVDDLVKKTRPETWHWKLIIFILIFVLVGLLYLLVISYFSIQLSIKPRMGLWK